MNSIGIQSSQGIQPPNPLPLSWLGLNTRPPVQPTWANFGALTGWETQCLLAQMSYDLSNWDYTKVAETTDMVYVGKYQNTAWSLEYYGLLTFGSFQKYGPDCVNLKSCWNPRYYEKGAEYQKYFYNCTSLNSFLLNKVAQEHLAYQGMVDVYSRLVRNGSIQSSDSKEYIAGMIYVGSLIGWGSVATDSKAMNVSFNPNISLIKDYIANNPGIGTGAWAWRYRNVSIPDVSSNAQAGHRVFTPADAFASGRYAIAVLSKYRPG